MTNRGRQNLAVVAALVCALVVTTVQAQQVPIPTTAAQVPGPASGTAMTKAYVQMVGRMAPLGLDAGQLIQPARRLRLLDQPERQRAGLERRSCTDGSDRSTLHA